jgi:hypothetical protein
MAFGQIIKELFSTDEKNAAAAVQASFIRGLEAKEKTNREEAQRFIDWYNRDREAIIEHLKEAAVKSFDSLDDWAFPIINGVPRTVRRLSMAYREAPEREYTRDGETLDPESKEVAAIAAMYGTMDLNRKLRNLDRWSTLLNTVHAEVVMRKGAIDWDIRLRPDVTVIQDPDDYLAFSALAYKLNVIDPNTLKPVDGWVYWTADRHIFISGGGQEIGMSVKDGSNPYKDGGEPVIPIATIRKQEDVGDYWGRFGADLVEAIQSMNIQLGNIWETTTLQVHGQPLFINIELEPGQEVLLGPKHPLVAKKVTKDDVPPDVKFPKPDPDIQETQAFLDWFIKGNASAYGMPPSAWSMDEQRLSGFAKFMDNIELLEMREEDQTQWQAIESDLFRKSVIVWNYWNEGSKVAEDLDVRVTFPAAKIVETPLEEAQRWTMELADGRRSLVDYFVDTEGLDRARALERALEVAKEKREISAAGPQPLAILPKDEPAEPDEPEDGDE